MNTEKLAYISAGEESVEIIKLHFTKHMQLIFTDCFEEANYILIEKIGEKQLSTQQLADLLKAKKLKKNVIYVRRSFSQCRELKMELPVQRLELEME